MGCPLDDGDNVKIEKKYYALGQGGFVVYLLKNQLNFKVKRSNSK